MVAGPPASQSRMTPLALAFGVSLSAALARASSGEEAGQRQAEQPGGADREEVAAVEAFAIGPADRGHGNVSRWEVIGYQLSAICRHRACQMALRRSSRLCETRRSPSKAKSSARDSTRPTPQWFRINSRVFISAQSTSVIASWRFFVLPGA